MFSGVVPFLPPGLVEWVAEELLLRRRRIEQMANQMTPDDSRAASLLHKAWPHLPPGLVTTFTKVGLGADHPMVLRAAELQGVADVQDGRNRQVGDVVPNRGQSRGQSTARDLAMRALRGSQVGALVGVGQAIAGSETAEQGAQALGFEDVGDVASQTAAATVGGPASALWGGGDPRQGVNRMFAVADAPLRAGQATVTEGVLAASTDRSFSELHGTSPSTPGAQLLRAFLDPDRRVAEVDTGTGILPGGDAQAAYETARRVWAREYAPHITAHYTDEEQQFVTPGRAILSNFMTPATTRFEIATGLTDLVSTFALDPAALATGGLSRAAHARKVPAAAQGLRAAFPQAARAAERLGIHRGRQPVVFGDELLNTLTRKPEGRRAVKWLADEDSFDSIWRAWDREIDPELGMRLRDARTENEVVEVLRDSLMSGRMRELPGPTGPTSGVTRSLAQQMLGDMGGVVGLSGAVRHGSQRIVKGGLRSAEWRPRGGGIDLENTAPGLENLDRHLANAKVPMRDRSQFVEEFAAAASPVERRAVAERAHLRIAQQMLDQEALTHKVGRVARQGDVDMVERSDGLFVPAGSVLKESDVRRIMRRVKSADDSYRAYWMDEITGEPKGFGVREVRYDDGTSVKLPTALALTEMETAVFAMPDPREIRRAVSPFARILANRETIPNEVSRWSVDLLADGMARGWQAAQLIGRPVAWFTRVFAESQARIGVEGLDSFMSHPWNTLVWMSSTRKRSYELANIDEYLKAMNPNIRMGGFQNAVSGRDFKGLQLNDWGTVVKPNRPDASEWGRYTQSWARALNKLWNEPIFQRVAGGLGDDDLASIRRPGPPMDDLREWLAPFASEHPGIHGWLRGDAPTPGRLGVGGSLLDAQGRPTRRLIDDFDHIRTRTMERLAQAQADAQAEEAALVERIRRELEPRDLDQLIADADAAGIVRHFQREPTLDEIAQRLAEDRALRERFGLPESFGTPEERLDRARGHVSEMEQFAAALDRAAPRIPSGAMADDPQSLDTIMDWLRHGSGRQHLERLATWSGRDEMLSDPHFLREWLKVNYQQRLHEYTGGSDELISAIATGRLRGVDVRGMNVTGHIDPEILQMYGRLGLDMKAGRAQVKAAIETERQGVLRTLRELAPQYGRKQVEAFRDPVTDPSIGQRYDKAMDYLFWTLFSKHDNRVTRAPVWAQHRWQRMREIAANADDSLRARMLEAAKEEGVPAARVRDLQAQFRRYKAGTLTADDWEAVDQLANHHAMKATKKLLYDVTQRGQISDVLRITNPFLEAWKEIMQTWLRLMRQNWSVPRRAQQAVEGARGAGFFHTDDNGDERFIYPGKGLFNAIGANNLLFGEGSRMRFEGRVQGLNLIGDVIPGFGPVVSVGGNKLLDIAFGDNPRLDDVRKRLAPFGVREGVAANIAPAWANRILEQFEPEASGARLATHMDVLEGLLASGRFHNEGGLLTREALDEAAAEASSKGDWVYAIRAFAQAFLPTGPQVEFEIDDGGGSWFALGALAEEYRELQDEHGYDEAFHMMTERYGVDIGAAFVTGRTHATQQRAVTRAGWVWQRENPDLVRDLPWTVGYFAPNPADEFDLEAFLDQYDDTRTQLNPRQRLHLRNHALGWLWFNNAREQAIEDGMSPEDARRAISNLRAEARHRYPGFDSTVPGLEASPDLERDVMPELRRAATKPEILATEAGQALASYFQAYDAAMSAAQNVLGQNGQPLTGFHRSTAPGAERIRQTLDGIGWQLTDEHPEFAGLWERVLRRELWRYQIEQPDAPEMEEAA